MSNRSSNTNDGNSYSKKTFARNVDATDMNAEQFMSYDLGLNGETDKSWNEMLDEFNKIDMRKNDYSEEKDYPVVEASVSDYDSENRDNNLNECEGDSDKDCADEIDNNKTEKNGNIQYDSNSVVSSFNIESNNKTDKNNLSGRLLALLAAAIFVAGIFFIIKLSNLSPEKVTVSEGSTQSRISDSDKKTEVDFVLEEISSEETISEEINSEQNPEQLYKELNFGDRSDEVLKMQKRLCSLGYITEASCTGYYGKFTKSKIETFQKAAGLEVTGTADPFTLARLYSDDAPNAN